MPKIVSIIILGLGGYYLFQKRYRVINLIMGNSLMRRLFVKILMNIPGIRGRVMGFVFPQNPSPV